VQTCLGRALLAQGQVRDGLQELQQAGLSPALSGTERAAAQAWVSFARLSLGDLDGAVASAEEARSAAASAGDPMSTSIAMTTLARAWESRGHLRDALQIMDDAARLADESRGRLGHRNPIGVTRGHILIELDRPEDARSALSTGRRISKELGVRWLLASYQVFLAFERFACGEWDGAIAELEASIELAEETGYIYSRVYAHGMLSLISLHRNELSRAEETAAAAAGDLAGWGTDYRMTWAEWPRALILEVGGEPRQALAVMAGIWDTYAGSGHAVEYPALGADLVWLALAAGDTGRARRASAAVTEVASRNEVPSMTGAALLCRGLVEDDPEILQAAATYARGSCPLERALACQDAGAAFARHGHADRARPLLDRAIGIYEQLGAARDLARAEATLREIGIRRGRRGARQRPQVGWHSLTPTELTVAGLVAEGLSNPPRSASACTYLA
jgi:tetratricopeptide (TPR) repeat protein